MPKSRREFLIALSAAMRVAATAADAQVPPVSDATETAPARTSGAAT